MHYFLEFSRPGLRLGRWWALATCAACMLLLVSGCVSKQKVTKGSLAQVDRSRITVSATEGATAVLTERVVLRNTGDTPLDWTLTPDATWLLVVPGNGSVPAKQSRTIDITVDPTGLEGGVYEASVVVQTNERKAQRLTITVEFTWNRAPVPAPVFTQQPVDLVVADGASATFAALASASGARIAYRWERTVGTSWVAVAGASLADLGVVATLSDHDSRWRCIAETLGGSATSAEAVLQVQTAAPVITGNPADVTVEEDSPVRLSASAVGSPVLAWSWQRSANGVTWVPVAGASSADLDLLVPILGDDGARFRAVVANGAGSATSAAARLSVVPRVVMPSILSDPVATSAVEGGVGLFTATATGSAPLAWAWERSQDGAEPWVMVAGGAEPNLAVAAESINHGAFYRARVANARGLAVSAAAEFQVLAVAPVITRQPLPAGAVVGGTARFIAAATGSAVVWSWERSADGGTTWQAITGSGADSDSLALTGVTLADDGIFVRAVVTGTAGTATSDAVRLSVSAGAIAPVITTAPTDAVVADGATVAFTVAATGTAPLVYQWQRSDDAGVTWADAGSGLPALTLGVTLADQGARFRCRVTNSAGAVTSSAAVLTVTAVAPSIVTDPLDQWVAVGSSASFTVATAGTVTAVVWQESQDGGTTWADLSTTGTTLVRTSLSLGDNGRRYRAQASGPGGTVWSSSALLTVTPALVAPSIVTDPSDQTVADGATAAFTVVAQGSTPRQIQWQRSADSGATWIDESGAMQTTLVVDASLGVDQHRFRVVVTNTLGSATSAAAVLTVIAQAPVILVDPSDQSAVAGATATFAAQVGGSLPNLSWEVSSDGGTSWTTVAGAVSPTVVVTVSLGQNGWRYRIRASNGAGTAVSLVAVLTVTATPVAPSISLEPVSATVADGATTALTVVVAGTSPLAYQWQRSADGGLSWSDAGSGTTTQEVDGVLGRSGERWRCRISNPYGSVLSAEAVVIVQAVAPVIVAEPASQWAVAGGTAVFTLAVTGSVPSYQWQRSTDGGVTWVTEAGAISSNLSLTGVTSGMSGHRFRCVDQQWRDGDLDQRDPDRDDCALAAGDHGDARQSSGGGWGDDLVHGGGDRDESDHLSVAALDGWGINLG